MVARFAILIYAVASYAIFLASFLYAPGFVGNVLVPRSIDIGPIADMREAIGVDLLLIWLFAVPHSVMARPGFKAVWRRLLPQTTERSTYVLVSSLLLMLLFWQWRPIPATVWHVEGLAATMLTGAFWLGWLIVLSSSYMIDHAHLFGVRQAADALFGWRSGDDSFRAPLLYKVVRHPLMLGFLIAFWATPTMSVGHLLLAGSMTLYILVALHFEERDLVAAFGTAYLRYQAQVPMLVPRLFGRRTTGAAAGEPADNAAGRSRG